MEHEMTIDLNHYISSKVAIQKNYLRRPEVSLSETASLMATATHVPVIACHFYLGELTGWKEESLEAISRLIDFYGYTKIDSIPEGYTGRRVSE